MHDAPSCVGGADQTGKLINCLRQHKLESCMRRVSSFAGRSKKLPADGPKANKRFSIAGNLKTMASKASMLKRRTAQDLFELASKVKDVDPELVDLIEKMEKYEKEIVSAKKALEPFAGETRKYCDVLETAALQGWKLSHAITDSQTADDPKTKVGKVQQTMKQLNTYQESIGDARRAICDVYEEEVLAPIVTVSLPQHGP